MSGITEIAGAQLDLTGMERAVLGYLLLNTGTVVRHADLHAAVYPADAVPVASNVIEVIISRLRKKIAASGARFAITTLRSRGYRLDPLETGACAAQ